MPTSSHIRFRQVGTSTWYSHHRPSPVTSVEDVDMNDLRNEYRDFENMTPTAKRSPLLVTGPLDT